MRIRPFPRSWPLAGLLVFTGACSIFTDLSELTQSTTSAGGTGGYDVRGRDGRREARRRDGRREARRRDGGSLDEHRVLQLRDRVGGRRLQWRERVRGPRDLPLLFLRSDGYQRSLQRC